VTDFVSGPVAAMWGMSDLVTPFALRVAATLELADHISSGATSIEELAERTGADADALGRLVRFLAVKGVVVETDDGLALSALGEVLRGDHPSRIRDWLDLRGFGGRLDRTMGELFQAIESGGSVHETVHGRPFWEDLAAHPEIGDSFDSLMTAQISPTVPHILRRFDWSGIRSVVDVGGGNGTLLAALAERHPDLQGVLVDLPGPAAEAEHRFKDGDLGERCRVVTGSFFDPLPPDADAYVLATVLHDWSDTDAVRILANCRTAAGAGGRVVIIDYVADDQNPEAVAAMDLRMLVLLGGRERTIADFEELVTAAGLTIRSVTRLPLWGRAIIDCVRSGIRDSDAGVRVVSPAKGSAMSEQRETVPDEEEEPALAEPADPEDIQERDLGTVIEDEDEQAR
jgi:SAM-dependent methyltransferase